MRSLSFRGRVLLLFGACAFITACVPHVETVRHVYQRDITATTSLSALKLNLPTGETKKAQTSYMVAFMAPTYEAGMLSAIAAMRETQKQYAASVAMFQLQLQQRQQQALAAFGLQQAPATEMVGLLYRKMDAAKADYLEQVKKTLQKDLEHILLSKAIRVLGPFPTHDEMTFDEKKRAIYTFTPEIFLAVDTKQKGFPTGDAQGYQEEGEIIVNGWIAFTLRETITGEKLWVKRMEAVPVSKPYKMAAKYKDTYRVQYKTASGMYLLGIIPLMPNPTFEDPAVAEMDETDKVLASALSDFYAGLGDKLWKHVDPEEWEKYLGQAEQIRKEKRF